MLDYYLPEPCRALKTAIQGAAETYAEQIGFEPGNVIGDVVQALGGRIILKDAFDPVSGAESICVRSQADFDIFIPRDTSPARDRFTIAHELGHLLLHYPVVCRSHPTETSVRMRALRYLSPNPTDNERRCEWEANWFAAAFLMPSAKFTAVWQAKRDISLVARYFQVSTAAAENRRSSLSLA